MSGLFLSMAFLCLSLHGFKTRIGLTNHIDTTSTFYNLTITVTCFRAFQ